MRPLVLFTLTMLLASSASAQACTPRTSEPEADAGGFYVDIDFGDLFSVWVYQESNGYAGLQRNDEIVDDTCAGMIPGDTIIF